MSDAFARNKLCLAVMLASGLAAGEAMAQLEEVMVTAQKRTESLQDIPIAISALNADEIEARGIVNAVEFGLQSPNIQTPAFPFSNNNIALFIRGIGNADSIVITKDNTVGLYYDGVYAARPTGVLSDLSDLERVEILRGPQGTLYGRNTTSGAINFINAKPSGEFGFKQTLSAGEYDSWRSVSHLDLPELAGFKAKVSATFSDRDGWVDNEGPNEIPGYEYTDYNENETEGYRFALRYDGVDRLLVDYSYDYSDVTHSPGYFQYAGPVGGFDLAGNPVTDSFTDRLEETRTPTGGGEFAYYLPESDTEVEGHNLTITFDISDSMSFKSITGYREFDDDASQNFSQSFGNAGSLETNTVTDHDQFSQEFQLLGTADKFEYVAGLYYFEEEGEQGERQYTNRGQVDQEGILALDIAAGFIPCSDGRTADPICTDFVNGTFGNTIPFYLGEYVVETDVESMSAYGQVTWSPDDAIDFTLGLRYTDDDRDAERTFDAWPFNGFAPGASESDKEKTDYTIVVNLNLTDDVSTYLKTATGFRSGGSSRNGLDFNKAFQNEDVISYEWGLKSEFWDNRIRSNVAVFFQEVDDIILDYLPDPINNPQFVEAFNSGDAEIWGVEWDAQAALTDNFFVTFNYAYLDYDINDAIFPDGSDRTETTELQYAPEHAYSVAADYNLPLAIGELRFHVDYSWQDDQYTLANTEFGEIKIDDFGQLNGRISLAEVELFGGNWQFAAWGRNLTDEEEPNYLIGGTATTFQAPRMYGGEIIFEF